MPIANINYKATVQGELFSEINFKSYQYVHDTGEFKIIFFKSGKCRIMGCKRPLCRKIIAFSSCLKIRVQRIQSITFTHDLQRTINLFKLSKSSYMIQYEPEIFPAARLMDFRPLCVNVFASGKIVITGLRTLQFQKTMSLILCRLLTLL